MKRFAILAVIALMVAGSASAAGRTSRLVRVVKRSGAFTATLTYRDRPKNRVFPSSDVVVRISRDGSLLVHRKLCRPDARPAFHCEWGASASLSVQRAGMRNQPAFLMNLSTGGNTCCTATFVAIVRNGVVWAAHTAWPNYLSKRIRGRQYFVSRDQRFYCGFSVCAGSATPIQIWELDAADRFVDVTRNFPGLIRADARRLAAEGGPGETIKKQGSGVLAAWCGDEYLLGRGLRCTRTLRYAVSSHWPKGLAGVIPTRAFVRALNRALTRWGYKRR